MQESTVSKSVCFLLAAVKVSEELQTERIEGVGGGGEGEHISLATRDILGETHITRDMCSIRGNPYHCDTGTIENLNDAV